MRRVSVFVALVLVASSAFAAAPAGYERMVLSIAPSYAMCARFSRYDTRLYVFNDGAATRREVCLGDDCQRLPARKAVTINGPLTTNPLPAFIYVPSEQADRVHMKLMVESTNHGINDRAFTEIPIIRESEFKQRIQVLGVRVDDGFRVTLRVYGLDIPDGALSTMRIYDMATDELLYQQIYGFQHFPNAPSVAMECDIGVIGWWIAGRDLRVEVESSSDDARIYAFVSTTDNATQRFTTITPK